MTGLPPGNPAAPGAPVDLTVPPLVHRPIPKAPSAARALIDAVSPDARAATAAESLVKSGFSVEKVREAMGDPSFEPDSRSRDQRDHDEAHGVCDYTDANLFRVVPPPGLTFETAKDHAAFDTAARNLVADTGFSPEGGRNFITGVMRATAELNDAADRGELLGKWQAQLSALYSPERIEAASAEILNMLALAGDNDLVAEFKQTGLLRNAVLFTALANRAAAFALWKSSRPK